MVKQPALTIGQEVTVYLTDRKRIVIEATDRLPRITPWDLLISQICRSVFNATAFWLGNREIRKTLGKRGRLSWHFGRLTLQGFLKSSLLERRGLPGEDDDRRVLVMICFRDVMEVEEGSPTPGMPELKRDLSS